MRSSLKPLHLTVHLITIKHDSTILWPKFKRVLESNPVEFTWAYSYVSSVAFFLDICYWYLTFFPLLFFIFKCRARCFGSLAFSRHPTAFSEDMPSRGLAWVLGVAWMSVGGLATPHSLLSTQLTDKLFLIMTLQTIIPAKNWAVIETSGSTRAGEAPPSLTGHNLHLHLLMWQTVLSEVKLQNL